MKLLFVLLVLAMFSSCAHKSNEPVVAAKPAPELTTPPMDRTLASEGKKSKYMNDKYMGMANLEGVEILDSEGNNQVLKKVRASDPSKDIIKRLMEESGDDALVSRIFSSAKENSSTVYVFITRKNNEGKEPTFRMNLVVQFKNGSMSLIDFDIVDANPKEMTATNGPVDGLETFKILAETSFFPF